MVVSYTDDAEIQSSKKFLAAGLQTAAGVPLQCDEPADFRTFRIGLFGLEKWRNVTARLGNLPGAGHRGARGSCRGLIPLRCRFPAGEPLAESLRPFTVK